MNFKLNLKMGQSTIEISDEVENTQELFERVSFFTSLPTNCDNCKKEDLGFAFKETKDNFKYYSLKCKACGYSLKMGQSKKGGNLFAKNWEAPYLNSDINEDSDQQEVVVEKEEIVQKTIEKEEVKVENKSTGNSVLDRIKAKKASESPINNEVSSTPAKDYRSIIEQVRANKLKGLNKE
jgi:hypothetical protein